MTTAQRIVNLRRCGVPRTLVPHYFAGGISPTWVRREAVQADYRRRRDSKRPPTPPTP